MGKWSNYVNRGLLAAAATALVLSGAAFADIPQQVAQASSTSTRTTTTTTTTNVVPPAGGYYDQAGVWHSGNNPFANGWYDANGMWHASATVSPNGISTNVSTGYYDQAGVWHSGVSPYSNGFYDQNGMWHSTTSTTVTTNLSNGYYDQAGVWHTGANPYTGGYYDQSGVWHSGAQLTSTTTTTQTYGYVPNMWDPLQYNYYAGYGSMADIHRGYVNLLGPDGQMHQVSLRDNRTFVRLTNDNNLSNRLNEERGFDRGMADQNVSSFDPQILEIPAGQHVTFFTDPQAGPAAHSIQPMDGQVWDRTVILTPGQVWNWTFTQPGWYRLEDSFGGGPTTDHIHGLMIHVTGNAVAWDDSMFENSTVVSTNTLNTMQTTQAAQTYNTVQTTTLPETQTTVTQEQNVQVQGQHTKPVVKKVHKRVLRNRDIK